MSIWMNVPKDHGTAKGIKPQTLYGAECYMEESYRGCVITKWEQNGYDDSDFYALVWDEAEQKVKTFEYASTRGWSYPNGAEIDCTPENLEKAYAYNETIWISRLTCQYKQESKKLERGREVVVVAGRKIPLGTKGYIMDVFDSRFGKCAKLQIGNNAVLTNPDNVQVVNPEQYLPTDEEIKMQAHGARTNFCTFRGY